MTIIPNALYTFSFEKLDVWKRSIDLITEVYLLTGNFPEEEKFGIISQMRRAALSISNNLSEGTSRTSPKDQANFTQMAFSSLMEVLNIIIVSLRLNYIDERQYLHQRQLIEEISNKLNALRASQMARTKKK